MQHDRSDAKTLADLWQQIKPAGWSRRHFLALFSTGGAAAVAAAYGLSPAEIATAQDATATPAPEEEPTSAFATPPGDSLHVKPLPDPFFVSHGASVEMRWGPENTESFTMDSGSFFVRNHTATPIVDPGTWELTIDGDGVDDALTLSYEDLLGMPAQTVTRFVECAGNGRALYDQVLDNPGEGTQWLTGGYGVGTWTGVRLSMLLEQAGLNDDAVSIMATGLDESGFEKPLPVEKAMADDTMIVYGMNGGPLPHDHGFPARLLVPGWVGSYNVKWLRQLTVATEQLYSRWNTASYVLIGPEYEDPEGPPEGEIIREQTVKSAIALPWPAILEPGQHRISGYAWSPYGRIEQVEVSLDDGESYEAAQLIGPNVAAAGVRWEYTLEVEEGDVTITTRATDTAGNSQWPIDEQLWNQKGYVWGAVIPHPVTVTSDAPAPTATADGTATATTPTPATTPSPSATTAATGGATAGELAMAGQEVYAQECAECHGDEGGGGTGPAVIGDGAQLGTYGDAQRLYDYISATMPQNNPGSLSDQQYLEVLAYMLVENELVSSDQAMAFGELNTISLR